MYYKVKEIIFAFLVASSFLVRGATSHDCINILSVSVPFKVVGQAVDRPQFVIPPELSSVITYSESVSPRGPTRRSFCQTAVYERPSVVEGSFEPMVVIIMPPKTKLAVFLSGYGELTAEKVSGVISVWVQGGGDFEIISASDLLADLTVAFLSKGCCTYEGDSCCFLPSRQDDDATDESKGMSSYSVPVLSFDMPSELPDGYYSFNEDQHFSGEVNTIAFASCPRGNVPIDYLQLRWMADFVREYRISSAAEGFDPEKFDMFSWSAAACLAAKAYLDRFKISF